MIKKYLLVNYFGRVIVIILIPLFNYNNKTQNYKILDGAFVTSEKGTGIVHIAPAFGEDDFNLCVSSKVIDKEFTNLFMPELDILRKFTR